MDFSRRFALRLAVRLAMFGITTVALVCCISYGGWPTTTIIAGGMVVWAAITVWSFANRTNVELARFVNALNQRDLAQSFTTNGRGSGFDELSCAFNGAIQTLRALHAKGIADNSFSDALVDGAPTPLLAIDPEGRIEMANKAARRLFKGVTGVRIDDYSPFGTEFVEALHATPTGRRSTRLLINGLPQRAMLSVTSVNRGKTPWRIVSVQVIQHELDQAEATAQADLVRVLTHEIMNSITPITSLADSAARLMATIDDGSDPMIGDIRNAIQTLARRADEMMHFVESYREFARTPAVTTTTFDAFEWADELIRLFQASPVARDVSLDVKISAAGLMIEADRALMTQVVLNLLKNGAEAASGHAVAPAVGMEFAMRKDGRIDIVVSDNGPGIPATYKTDIFLPFFTSKTAGTGVGLSFARQIILLHGGGIYVLDSEHGACIKVVI